jgi:glyoxylase-like metal-dependent hydrolase (beta-lactamase superfamily II)
MSSRRTSKGPWLARLLAPAGPPVACRVRRCGADVQAVPGRYSVTYLLLGPEAIGVVDLGSQADIPAVLDAVAALGRSPTEIRWVMPSHLHFDHVMGMDAFARRCGVPVLLGRVAWESVTGARRLRFGPRRRLLRAIPTWPLQGMPFPPLADWREGLDFGLPWGKNRFRAGLAGPLVHGGELPGLPGWVLLEGPGHADDAILLHHPDAGLLVVGDTVRNFYGGEWNPLLCDPEDYARTRQLISTLHIETIFPAHGPVLDGIGIVRRIRAYPAFVP